MAGDKHPPRMLDPDVDANAWTPRERAEADAAVASAREEASSRPRMASAVFLSSARIWSARIPCPGAGSIHASSRSSDASWVRPRRWSPAAATTTASRRPSFTLAIRVGTFAHSIAWARQRDHLPEKDRPDFDPHYADLLRRAIGLTA